MNKKGGERVLSFYWFLIFGIIAIAVVSGVFIFYSAQTDVRKVEANILADRVINCFVEKGKINAENFNGAKQNGIETTCDFSFKDENYRQSESEQFYVKVSLTKNGAREEIKTRMSTYEGFCGQEKSKKNIPLCAEKKVVVSGEEGYVLLEVLTAVRKVEQNAVQ